MDPNTHLRARPRRSDDLALFEQANGGHRSRKQTNSILPCQRNQHCTLAADKKRKQHQGWLQDSNANGNVSVYTRRRKDWQVR